MADNIYLLETRLSKAQQTALAAVRDVARARSLTVFLVGGAVRDLIGGTAVRDLDVVVQGNALKLRKDIEKAGGVVAGEMEAGQSFYVRFPGGVRMEIGSTLTVTYPKPGKAVAKPATILDDLRRRDFTANAMALSLNEGSYGLLMDPLNGVADIENRELRLVSNYGFIEDPARMIRATRFGARLGWHMDEKTQSRYETGKAEGYISALDEFHRGYETEEIFHEEDPLRVIRRLEEEGWMQHLAPSLSALKANVAELERLRESQAQLQTQGIVADAAAASFPLLTAKMAPKEIEGLKKSFPRQGFVAEIEALEARGKEFATQLGGKGGALPSQAYKLMTSGDPEAVLWVAHTTKSGNLQGKFRSFYTDWQQARQRVPYVQMQEMRITPDLPVYEELVEKLFFELMDGKLQTPEEMKAFLEPYSPPAPPPPVSLRRPRAPKKDAKPAKSRKKAAESPEDADIGAEADGVEAIAEPSESPLAVPPPAPKVAAKGERPAKEEPAEAAEPRTGKATAAEAAPAAKVPGKATPNEHHAPAKNAVATPAKKVAAKSAAVTATKKAPTKSAPPARKAVPDRRLAPPAKGSIAKKVVPAKKAVPAKKGATKAIAAKKAVPSKVSHGGKASKKAPVKAAAKKSAAKGAPSKKAVPAKKRR